jgi:LacI family transcriptional regulator
MSSIRQVAKQAGVSIATVSRVVNGVASVDPELRQRVLKVVEAIDYSPAIGKRTADAIALVYAGPVTTGSIYDAACIDGIVEALRGTDCDLRILNLARDREQGEALSQFLARKGARGAVVRCTTSERTMVENWAAESTPFVVLGDHFDHPQLSFVYAASRDASRQAVELLLSLNHHRIAFAACERDDGDHFDRFDVYRQVLQTRGLFDANIVCRVPPHRTDGAQIVRNLLSIPNRPTAIYIADPLIAIGALNECHRLRVQVPDDLSIIGFDDSETRTYVFPRLTAVCQDSTALGRLAVQLLLAKLQRQSGTNSAVAPQAWLDIGNTTGPAPERVDRILPSGERVLP